MNQGFTKEHSTVCKLRVKISLCTLIVLTRRISPRVQISDFTCVEVDLVWCGPSSVKITDAATKNKKIIINKDDIYIAY